MTNYLVADIAVRLMVSNLTYNKKAKLPKSVFSFQLVSLFWKHGLIHSFSVKNEYLEVQLKYVRRKSLIKSIKVISTPGRRVYWSLNYLSKMYNTNNFGGFYIISTPKGLYTSTECLTTVHLSGEILYKIVLR